MRWIMTLLLACMAGTLLFGQAVDQGTETRRFFVWGLDHLESMRGSAGIGGLVAIVDDSTGQVWTPVHDAQGNVIALLDPSGKAQAQWHYGAFGENLGNRGRRSSHADLCPFGWQGRLTDPDTGLV